MCTAPNLGVSCYLQLQVFYLVASEESMASPLVISESTSIASNLSRSYPLKKRGGQQTLKSLALFLWWHSHVWGQESLAWWSDFFSIVQLNPSVHWGGTRQETFVSRWIVTIRKSQTWKSLKQGHLLMIPHISSFFPACWVKVVRCYVSWPAASSASSPPPPPPPPPPPDLNCKP